jgi:hypothetical protein
MLPERRVRLTATQKQLRISDSELDFGDSRFDIFVAVVDTDVAKSELPDSDGNAVAETGCASGRRSLKPSSPPEWIPSRPDRCAGHRNRRRRFVIRIGLTRFM